MGSDTHLLKVELWVSEFGMLAEHLLLVGILVGVGRRNAEVLDGFNPRVEMGSHRRLPQDVMPDKGRVKQLSSFKCAYTSSVCLIEA